MACYGNTGISNSPLRLALRECVGRDGAGCRPGQEPRCKMPCGQITFILSENLTSQPGARDSWVCNDAVETQNQKET